MSIRVGPACRTAPYMALLASCALSACGGGGSGVNSTPTPPPAPIVTPAPAPAPTPTPTATNYDTAEYRRSDGPVEHGAITAYREGASGKGITVGIIDSGIATANAEFAGRISTASQDFANNGSIEDVGGHGTAVATVLAAARNDRRTLGVAWESTILALRTDTAGTCATEDPANPESGCQHDTRAITRALDHARVSGARVVNISLGGGGVPPTLRDAVDRATAAGIIIVVSSGNDGTPVPDDFATSIVNANQGRGLVIIAASVDASGVHSSFSDGAQGYEQSTLSALGERVLSQDHTGAQFLYSGTSFSAPQIAGAAALLAQAFPNLSGTQIVNLLLTSATDAGDSGPDAVYGRGILNIARAFAPLGPTSLAGSAIPLSFTANGTLSPAMGDAAGQASPQVVALDSLGRAYGVDIRQTLERATPNLNLAPALQSRARSISASAGPLSVAMTIAPGRDRSIDARQLTLTEQDAARARTLSGSILTRLGRGTTVALGFSEGGSSIAARMAGAVQPAFLIAGRVQGQFGFDHVAASSVGVQHALGGGLALTATGESGRVWQRRDIVKALSDPADRERYSTLGLALSADAGAWHLQTGLTYLREDGTLLGARFSPAVGMLSGRSLFLDAAARFDAGNGWGFGLSLRQGWTSTNSRAGSRARLTSNAWAVDAERAGLFDTADRFALRLSQPLRVETGGLRLNLPTAYDYGTRSASMNLVRLGLAPQGRQIDQEAVYSLPIGPGWLTSNLYWRRQSGNLAWFSDELGGAMRYALSF